jgi:HEXXH motif-containing protein
VLEALRARSADDADAGVIARVVAELMERDVGAIASLLRRPHVSTLLRLLRSSPAPEAAALRAELGALLVFDLAWLGVLPGEVRLRRIPPRLVSLTAGAIVESPPDTLGATLANGRMTIECRSGRHDLDLDALARGATHPAVGRPYRAVRGDIVLALADNNPSRHLDAHPERTKSNVVDLGGHSEDAWLASLGSALDVVERFLPAMRADIDVALQQIVPIGFEPERHFSCSYQENLGTIYLSLHPSLMTMVEAIIHEVSHNKLNALFDLDPVLENRRDQLYGSPVRPDPRPLHGVLLAVHAFLPVARLYERMLADDPDSASSSALRPRFEAIVRTNREGTGVLRTHAAPSAVGRGLLEEILHWDDHFRAVAPAVSSAAGPR